MRAEGPPRWVAGVSVAGVVGVAWYITSWALADALTPDHDPLRQAISELFAIGAPALPRLLVSSGLVVSGVALVAFSAALHRGLPGAGVAGPVAAAIAGMMTVLVVLVPCTHGCPGAATSTTDALHVLVAGTGYVALMLAPLFVSVRVRPYAPGLARWSLVLGGVALLGLVVRNVGVDALAGLQQRTFNTVADAWYVVAAVHIVRSGAVRSSERPRAGRDTSRSWPRRRGTDARRSLGGRGRRG